VSGILEVINGAQISSSTFASGNAGNLTVSAGSLKIDQQLGGFTGIISDTLYNSEGNAGTVNVTVDGVLELVNGAEISSSTFANGNGGDVTVKAEILYMDGEFTGIYAQAYIDAVGYAGNVVIIAETVNLVNGGKIGIIADQALTEELLSNMPQNLIYISTKELHLDQNAKITAESTQNVPAGTIIIQANEAIIESSSITTSSNDADGGSITIQGDHILLHDGFITTSVAGSTGDGGDITIRGISDNETFAPADALILKGGFIQANTGADGASGGNISVNISAVIADAEGTLQIGGEERQEFLPGTNMNIIQAAAPGGEQGNINITAPEIDVSSAIVNTGAYFVNPAQLATNPCLAVNSTDESALIQGSRGGILEGPEAPLTVYFIGEHFGRLINEEIIHE